MYALYNSSLVLSQVICGLPVGRFDGTWNSSTALRVGEFSASLQISRPSQSSLFDDQAPFLLPCLFVQIVIGKYGRTVDVDDRPVVDFYDRWLSSYLE